MLHKINNNNLYIALETVGASLCSLCDLHGTEYLWQGGKTTKDMGMPIIFLNDETVLERQFKVVEKMATKLVLKYSCAEQSLNLNVKYELMENTLNIMFYVENVGEHTKEYLIGAKPCFFVPIDEEDSFCNYVLKNDGQNYLFKSIQSNISEMVLNFEKSNTLSLYSLESGQGITFTTEALKDVVVTTLKSDDLLCITAKEKAVILPNEVKEHSIKIALI